MDAPCGCGNVTAIAIGPRPITVMIGHDNHVTSNQARDMIGVKRIIYYNMT